MSASENLRRELIDLLAREMETAREESGISRLLVVDALEASGRAIRNLSATECSGKEIVLRCPENTSRFRAGDSVEIAGMETSWSGRILEIMRGGLEFRIQTSTQAATGEEDGLTMFESQNEIAGIYLSALGALSPGAPGWWLLDVLAGGERGKRILERTRSAECECEPARLCADAGLELDPRSMSILAKCIGLPRLMAVQGPPGTGKSIMLALAAEGIARKGRRVAVLAHTHQAVNNALSCCSKLFPERRIAKVGSELRREGLDAHIPCVLLRDEADLVEVERMDATVYGLTFASATAQLCVRHGLISPHAVLIDEAGQLPLPYAASVGLVGASSYILFGDDKQMPPVFRTDPAESRCAVSIFARFREVHRAHVHQLEVTHRLNAELCTAVSTVFYDHDGMRSLSPSSIAAKRKFAVKTPRDSLAGRLLCSDASLCWVDSAGHCCRQSNTWDAERITELVSEALTAGVTASSMAVVVPFRRQVALVRSLLSELSLESATEVLVDTVERLQGMTVDLVILSATASDPEYIASAAAFLF